MYLVRRPVRRSALTGQVRKAVLWTVGRATSRARRGWRRRAAALCQRSDSPVITSAALGVQFDTFRVLESKAAVCPGLRPAPNRLADCAQAAKAVVRSLGYCIAYPRCRCRS